MPDRERAQAPPRGWPAELQALDALLRQADGRMTSRVVCEVHARGVTLPVHVATLGSHDPEAGAIGFFGGVHGLERIGTDVVISFLRQVLSRLRWDTLLQQALRSLRLVFMPLVNPGGLAIGTRANPQGVDLMRNAPVDCLAGAPALIGGHRLGPWLPWYRGRTGEPMQPEAQALCEVVEQELMTHRLAIALDCHSGFGLADRVWFPHAHTPTPMQHLPEVAALAALLDDTLPPHPYLVEPQSRQYLAHGDLWDHLLSVSLRRHPGHVLLPLTLEMGSWRWVKKNPRQFFSRLGLFNPVIVHRQQRVLRRHAQLLDFLLRAAHSHAHWRPEPDMRETWRVQGLRRWYGHAQAGEAPSKGSPE